MAGVGKKKRVNWKPVKTDIFIDASRKTTGNWEDEVAATEVDGRNSYSSEPRIPPKVELPTAPRASRGSAIDENKIPTVGPFRAYLSNIPYDLNEEELINFFQDLKIQNVKLPKEEKTLKAKGYGYIEFEDRAGLSAALSMGDTMLKGRVIKIDLPNHGDMGGRGNRGRGNRDGGRDQTSSDRTTGNWRSGARQDDFEDRGYDRGYGGRRDYGGSGGGSSGGGSGGGSGFSRGGFDREERGFYRDDRERSGGGGSSSGSHWRDEPRDRGFGGGRGFEERRDRGGDRDGGKFGPRRDDPPVDRGTGESRNRPKLVLKPRTKPKETAPDTPTASASASASIFGGAKPVDTAAREREIEERLMRSEDFSDSRSSKSGPGSTGSRSEKQWEPSEKKVEPAPPPKENAWSKKAPQAIVNNGRSSPEDEGPRSNVDSDERSHDESRSKRTGDDNRGGNRGSTSSDKSRGKESEKHSKLREHKESIDDISKMPKVPESKSPNFAGSNKYSSLVDSDEAFNE